MTNSALGTLYIVATPIGHLADLSARAIEILQMVAWIAVEDTRHSAPLLRSIGSDVPMTALHNFNESDKTAWVLRELEHGKDIALISDAGTPLISDPGFFLVRAARQAGVRVVPIPGACALIAALSVSGLPTDRFYFEGFLPAKSSARREVLKKLEKYSHTLIFYESPHRIVESLADLVAVLGGARTACVAREITKQYEDIQSGTLQDLYENLRENTGRQRGEFVVMVHGAPEKTIEDGVLLHAEQILTALLPHIPLNLAVQICQNLDLGRKKALYSQALAIRESMAESAP